jgi:YegS/Rv2252/BmrU family lipid kinase
LRIADLLFRGSIFQSAICTPQSEIDMRLAVIMNQAAGGGRPYKKLDQYLKNWPHHDWSVEVHSTYAPGHAGEIARELLGNPPDLLAICGGDGTVNEVASRVPNPPFPVALLPAGTANVLARELGLPIDPVRALNIALERVVRKVDLGVVRARTEHYFLLMAGVGFDAYIVSKVNLRIKQKMGVAAYYGATLRHVLTYSFPEFEVSTESETVRATSCLVANAQSYGGGLVLTPGADMSDGLLDVLVLCQKPKIDYLRFIVAAWRGHPAKYPWALHLKTRSAKISGPRGIWAHVDGELVGTLPLEVGVLPASFPLVVGTSGK